MTQPKSLSALLKQYNLRPRKGLGQNFLSDPFHLEKIVDAAGITPDDVVLEIGPGPGLLTYQLVKQASQVVAVEVDSGMITLLNQEFAHQQNLKVVEADILETQLDTLLDSSQTFKVVANLPYYITSAVIRLLLEGVVRPSCIVVTVQK
ncbi:MAG: rRNA adenine dimethyltransferase family protein, partial [Chloroflexota bacterium]